MKNNRIIITIILLSAALLLSAAGLNDTYQQMLKAYEKLNTLQAVISQTNYFSQSKAKLVSSGNFYYQKGKICVRYA